MPDVEKFCARCHLSIQKQPFKKLPRPTQPGKALSFAYWHARWQGDCWHKTVAEAKTRKEAQMTLPLVGKGVIF